MLPYQTTHMTRRYFNNACVKVIQIKIGTRRDNVAGCDINDIDSIPIQISESVQPYKQLGNVTVSAKTGHVHTC